MKEGGAIYRITGNVPVVTILKKKESLFLRKH